MTTLSVLDSHCDSLIDLLKGLDYLEKLHRRLISKIMNIAIRCTYYIFFRHSKDWTDPDLMDFETIFPIIFLFSILFVVFLKQPILHCLF